MTIDIICIGKIKEAFMRDAIEEYTKRISKFARINIIELKDEKTPDNASENESNNIKEKEAERIMKYVSRDAYIFTLCIEGKGRTSEEFSENITNVELKYGSHIQFIIGGSLGLADSIKALSNDKLSFSKMTFPHQLMRVILLEQIYRAYKIKNNEPYHK